MNHCEKHNRKSINYSSIPDHILKILIQERPLNLYCNICIGEAQLIHVKEMVRLNELKDAKLVDDYINKPLSVKKTLTSCVKINKEL